MKVTTQAELDDALANARVTDIIIQSPAGVWLEVISDHGKTVWASGSSTVMAYNSSTVMASGSSTVRAYDSSTVMAYNSSTVMAYDSSTVMAYDSSTVMAYGSSTVMAYDSSTVMAYGSSTVTAYDSSTVTAYDSSTVTAYGSSTVTAYDSSTVTAYDSSTVTAYNSSTVTAYGSSTVRAYDSSTVMAYDSSTVMAYGSSTVTASPYVAVHLHSAKVKVAGGIVIDVAAIDRSVWEGWSDYHGIEVIGGEAIVYKAVDKDLKSGRGFEYPIGETVVDAKWEPGNFCGSGLHFGPTPHHAQYYFSSATRFLKVAVPISDLSIIGGNTSETPKIKAKSCLVLAEVDINGVELTEVVSA